MKLRLRKNSLRLRVNRREAQSLASGIALQERVEFPGGTALSYIVEPVSNAPADTSFQDGVIRIGIPREQLRAWETSDEIGVYLEFPAGGNTLNIALEKDLECVDGPEEERDPLAFPRTTPTLC